MDKVRQEKLGNLLKLVNEGLTRQEFLESFKTVMNQVLKLETKLIEKIDYKTQQEKQQLEQLKQEFSQVIENAKKESDNTLGGFRRKTIEAINNLFIKNDVNKKLNEQLEKVNEKIIETDDKLSQIRNGINGINGLNGRDADEERIIKEVLSKIILPDYITELEKFKNEMIEEIRRNKRIGGGFSKIAMEGKFVDDETPTGTVNGVNTVFILANMPNPPSSVKVFVNGARMRITEDYTLSGKTITFVTAPPSGSIILVDYRT